MFPALKEPAEFSLSSIPHLFVLQKKQHSIQKFWMEGGDDAATIYCIACIALHCLRESLLRKNCCSFGFCPNYLPPPPNLDNLYHFFERQKRRLKLHSNDSLSKILIKRRHNTCFVCHVYNLKNSLKFKLLAFWRN